ncbi:methylglyoxal synthase [Porticoccus sp. W117]|uniref:methylglyoxal synthase n=1 Tax=Porticoccus sp. W117 TaxID=3054777 RepID=UPI002595261E|nr:methylglyoxal synthase [Porticoccus sp. W117]MDM3870061.1 methylglyoxal synthase [Porticoccus sp. W117]
MQIGLVAHDEMKNTLLDWVKIHRSQLANCDIVATGTTGGLILQTCPELNIELLKSGPLGGDQQIGARICEGRLNALIFFIDPLSPMPHDVDVKALTRLATLYNIPHAYNEATANLIAENFGRLPITDGIPVNPNPR